MILKVIKLKYIFIVILFLLIGLSGISSACNLIEQTLEKKPSGSQDKNIESEVNKKITGLKLPGSTEAYLLKAFQDKPDLFNNIYSECAFWEWLKSNQSATSSDIDTAIELAAKDKFYSADFIENLLELNEEELSALLADDTHLGKKHGEYLENLTESFFENGILFDIDRQTYLSYFPEDTKKLIYLPEELRTSVKKVVIEAVEAYPLGFVPQHLKKLYIIGNEIKIENVNDVIATATDETIFLTIGERNDETLHLPVFHHALNHLLQNKYKELFDSYHEDWISNNPEEFEYADYEPYDYDGDKLEMYSSGFFTSLSMVNCSEDFAEIAGYAFSKDPVFLSSLMSYARIKQKFELMVDCYNKINSGITLEYFEKISE